MGREDVLLGLVLLCATNGRIAAPVLALVRLAGRPRGARCSLAADVRLQALARHGAFLWKQ